MNATVKPLVWEIDKNGRWFAKTPFGVIDLVLANNKKYRIRLSGRQCVPLKYKPVEAAKLEAERWFTARVLDCLEPADKDTCAEFVTAYAQCNGEYDR